MFADVILAISAVIILTVILILKGDKIQEWSDDIQNSA